MFGPVVWFEVRYQLRQPLLWATAALFFVLAFVATITDALQLGGGIGSLNRNAPYVVVRMLGDLSLIGLFIVVATVSTAVLRDFEWRTDELIFSRPAGVRTLLAGRYLGASLAACLCFVSAAAGLAAGGLMPWLDPARVGPFDLRPHLFGLVMLAFPSFLVLGSAFFAVASRVRHMAGVYVALVALLVAYFVAVALLGDLETLTAAAYLDPFGLVAFDLQTRYWTVAQKNTQLPALAGVLLWNRCLWLGVGAIALTWAVSRFRYERAARRPRASVSPQSDAAPLQVQPRLRRSPPFGPRSAWLWLRSLVALEARAVVVSVPFLVVLGLALTNVVANMGQLDLMLGTPVWPVTHLMLLAIRAGYSFVLVIVLTYYAGEAVWRDRALRVDGIVDALPVPHWVFLVARLCALWIAVSIFIAAGMAALCVFQLAHGYTRLEPLLYAQGFLVETVPFLLTAVLALCLQVVVNQKYVAYLLTVLFLVSNGVLSALHFDHSLYRYAAGPPAPYSDMNGWGHFARPLVWFDVYWGCGAGVLGMLAWLAWVRGGEGGWRTRWTIARARWRGPARWASVALLAGFAAVGSFIFYNTNILNEYVPSDEAERRQAEYEHLYSRYRSVPQPRVAGVRADVAIFPDERRADIRASYRLVNRTASSVETLALTITPRARVLDVQLPPHRVVVDDRRLGFAAYRLAAPIAPGGEITVGFHFELSNPGFVASNADNTVVENGTFIHSHAVFPWVGYQASREIDDPAVRRRQHLPPAQRMPKIDDLAARERNDLAPDADWIDFDTTVSTSPDQTAIAPGELEREWTSGGRRYFHYVSKTPIPKFFSYASARYAVRRDRWQDVGIEVLYHPTHTYNIDRMVDAVKRTLSYMTSNFAPYQHPHVRIVEVPRYIRRAASFPNTIPFSESIGFIARLQDPAAIDYPYYVTAHEVAHQWWGYQVMGAGVQGASMLSESMAQYSALMVMEHRDGPETMRRFLRYELDRYLGGRGRELVEEMPLALVEDQPYIHYSKGSLALYALKDALGEDTLNEALRRYVASVRFKPPPYTVSRDLLAFVAEVAPADTQRLLHDLFESITLFDLSADDARAVALPDGRYEVTLKATARKLTSDGGGRERDVPVDDWIDIAVFGERSKEMAGPGPVLYFARTHITAPAVTVRLVVDGRPARAGIDPYNKLIDRVPGDNVRAVEAR